LLTETSRYIDFPSLHEQSYLNTAAEGIPPKTVVDALAQYGKDKMLGMDGRQLHEEQRRQARQQTAEAFGLIPEEIGICSCTSEAFNLANLALALQDGDEVVISDLDFPATATPWLQPSCPAEVKVWRARDGALLLEDLETMVGSRTRLVTVSLVSFFNGFRVSVPQIAELVHAQSGALLAIDVTQALGRIPLRLQGADLIVSSTHKWILSTHGGGLVGVPNARAKEWTVPAGGWFNLDDPFLREDRLERAVSLPGADSFSVGMPNYGAIYAANAALRYIQSVGIEAIDAYCKPLVDACLAGIADLPVELLTPRQPDVLAGILAFRHPDAEEINAVLHDQNIHIMSHAGRLRVAIHGYNTMHDIDRLIGALRKAMG
jgi:cysteine desulfurase/selenocysteine lyase